MQMVVWTLFDKTRRDRASNKYVLSKYGCSAQMSGWCEWMRIKSQNKCTNEEWMRKIGNHECYEKG